MYEYFSELFCPDLPWQVYFEIVDFIEIGELSGKLWDNMEMVVEIADNMGVAKSEAVITAYGGIAGLIKQAIMLGVFFSLFLLYFQITGAMM